MSLLTVLSCLLSLTLSQGNLCIRFFPMGVREVFPKLASVGREIKRVPLLHEAQAWLEMATDRGCGP